MHCLLLNQAVNEQNQIPDIGFDVQSLPSAYRKSSTYFIYSQISIMEKKCPITEVLHLVIQ